MPFRKIPTPQTEEEARDTQIRLAREIRLGDRFRTVAAVDVAYSRDGKWGYVCAVVLSTNNWSLIHSQKLKVPVLHRYEEDLLGFQEAPLLLEALSKLAVEADLILIDGNGIAHPRRFGLACHIGYSLDFPTVGVAKLWPKGCRKSTVNLPKKRGSKVALLHDPSGDKVGFELYLQDHVNPVFVSPGHRVSLEETASFALRCSPWFQAPEPLRQAEQLANQMKNEDV